MRIDVHVLDPAKIPADLLTLDGEEKKRAAAFRFDEDARHWTACRYGLRVILGRRLSLPPAEVPLEIGPSGKPRLAPPFGGTHFNLSHCRDLALIAIAPFPVGIDVEPKDRAGDLLGCEESFCHPQEIADLPSDEATRAAVLLRIWTAKEAVLKAVGTGLLAAPQSMAVDLSRHPGRVLFDTEVASQHLLRLGHPALDRHSAFVSSAALFPEVIYHPEFRVP